MGTDIHLGVEHYRNGRWRRVPPVESQRDEHYKKYEFATDDWARHQYEWTWRDAEHRNYSVFAMLADVRNGAGFAGIMTGEGFIPIAQPRGLPDDRDTESVTDDDFDLGDHSFSWLTLDEMLRYDWAQTTRQCGVITLSEFADREAHRVPEPPSSYCGGISGPGIYTLEEEQAREMLRNGGIVTRQGERPHVRTWWTRTYRDAAGTFYSDFLPALATLDSDPTKVRIVFGFDS